MPFKSQAQSRYIHMKANEGEDWARKFVNHSHGEKVPKVEHAKPKKRSLLRLALKQYGGDE